MPRIEAANVPEHRRQVHARVFEAFARLMSEHSYDAISMAQIAEGAGLGRTAIYHHFHDKEEVVVAFATHETAQYVEHLEALLAGIDDPAERLRIYVRNHLASGERFHMGLGPQLYGVLPPGSRAEIREHVLAVEQVLQGILKDGIGDGTFAVTDAASVTSLIHACLGARQVPPDQVEEFVLRAVSA